MKKIIFFFIMLGWVMNSHAQNQMAKSPEQKATHTADKLSKELALSADQKAKVYAIALEKATKIGAIKAQSSADKKAMHAQIKPIKDSYTAQINAILTPDQRTKWDQIRAQQKTKGEN